MSFSARADHLAPQERLLALPEGSFIEVRLLDKSKLHGRLDKVEASGFLITTPTPNHLDLVQRRIAFSELKSVKRVKDSRDYDSDWDKVAIVIALVFAFVVAPIAYAIGDR
jgi:hypothetical protein